MGESQLEVLAENTGEGLGWTNNTEYEFSFRYESSGDISVEIRRSSDGVVFWGETLTDTDPLGPGKVAFYNFSQSDVRYSGLQQSEFLPEGAYQLRVVSGANRIQTPEGIALDGDPSLVGGEDYIGSFVIDQTAPVALGVSSTPSQIDVSFVDIGGLDPISATNPANYRVISSGGDGTFGDGNEVLQPIDSIAFADASLSNSVFDSVASSFASEAFSDSLLMDVNADGAVSPMDALLVVNALGSKGGQGEATASNLELDVNRDGRISPMDVLHVINHLSFEHSETRAIELIESQVDAIFGEDDEDELDLLSGQMLF